MAEQPYIDPERMGVTGGSYGGYMTNWIIGHTAPLQGGGHPAQRQQLLQHVGLERCNWRFRVFGDRQTPWEDLERFLALSPMTLHRPTPRRPRW